VTLLIRQLIETCFSCRFSWNLGASTCWNPHGLSRPVQWLLYFHVNCSMHFLYHSLVVMQLSDSLRYGTSEFNTVVIKANKLTVFWASQFDFTVSAFCYHISVVTLMVSVFLDIALCRFVFTHRRFGDTCCRHLRGGQRTRLIRMPWKWSHKYSSKILIPTYASSYPRRRTVLSTPLWGIHISFLILSCSVQAGVHCRLLCESKDQNSLYVSRFSCL